MKSYSFICYWGPNLGYSTKYLQYEIVVVAVTEAFPLDFQISMGLEDHRPRNWVSPSHGCPLDQRWRIVCPERLCPYSVPGSHWMQPGVGRMMWSFL